MANSKNVTVRWSGWTRVHMQSGHVWSDLKFFLYIYKSLTQNVWNHSLSVDESVAFISGAHQWLSAAQYVTSLFLSNSRKSYTDSYAAMTLMPAEIYPDVQSLYESWSRNTIRFSTERLGCDENDSNQQSDYLFLHVYKRQQKHLRFKVRKRLTVNKHIILEELFFELSFSVLIQCNDLSPLNLKQVIWVLKQP